jgi:hypothetical protein
MNLQSSWMSSKFSTKTTSHLGHCHAGKTWTLCFPSAISRTEEWGVLDCRCCDRTHARRTILLSWRDRPVTIADHISRAYNCSARDRSWCHMHTWTCRPRLDVVLLATLDDYASIPHAGDCREYNEHRNLPPCWMQWSTLFKLSYNTVQWFQRSIYKTRDIDRHYMKRFLSWPAISTWALRTGQVVIYYDRN